jgi:hypothetical protein
LAAMAKKQPLLSGLQIREQRINHSIMPSRRRYRMWARF